MTAPVDLADLAETRLEFITRLYDERGHRMYGEAVSERDHALQCAAAAEELGAARPLVVAALLHDIGHLLHARDENIADSGIDMKHDVIGERYLRRWFRRQVSRPVGLHVQAKRYLCAVEDGYLASLSPASLQSLALQGGAMTMSEARLFRQDPFAEDALTLRRCDEDGKRPDCGAPGWSRYAEMIRAELVEYLFLGADQR